MSETGYSGGQHENRCHNRRKLGIGFETAKTLARLGYSVIGGRSGKTAGMREKIEAEVPSANVSFIAADLMHQYVNRAAAETRRCSKRKTAVS